MGLFIKDIGSPESGEGAHGQNCQWIVVNIVEGVVSKKKPGIFYEQSLLLAYDNSG